MNLSANMKSFHISGAVLKWIAIITMFIDHFGVTIMERYLRMSTWPLSIDRHTFYVTYRVCRSIGRLGFPLFCFLLVEGLLHTKHRGKYALRLLLFCFLSEFPFDLALFDTSFTMEHQNVFFTLLIGYLAIWGIDTLYKRFALSPVFVISAAGCVTLAYYAAEMLKTDYRGYGVLNIVAMYLVRELILPGNYSMSLSAGLIVLCLFNSSEYPAWAALLPMAFYDGSRGKQTKYFFYLFYPAHLLLLYACFVLFCS